MMRPEIVKYGKLAASPSGRGGGGRLRPPSYQDMQRQLIEDITNDVNLMSRSASVVEMQNDFASDAARSLCSVLSIPEGVGKEINRKIITPLRTADARHYFYPLSDLHMTIKNVRTVGNPPLFTDRDVEKVAALFKEIVPQFPAFDFELRGAILFPTSVAVVGYCDERLRDLVYALDSGLHEIGVPDNKRYVSDTVFFGSITVARFTEAPSPAFVGAVKNLGRMELGRLPVEEIDLLVTNAVNARASRHTVGSFQLQRDEDNVED